MQNSIKKISFQTEKGISELELGYHSLNNQYVNLDSLFQQFEQGFLVRPIHKFLQTQYILNEVKGCWILSFDETKTLISVKQYENETCLPNTYLILEEYVVFLPIESELPFLKVERFEINYLNVAFIDKEHMQIFFSVLIINVESINNKYGQLNDFINEYSIAGETNGKLLVLSEMMEPPIELLEFIDKELNPLGFEEKKDYLICYEQLVKGVKGSITPLLNMEIPECVGVDWLGSIIKMEGNYIWYKSANSDLKMEKNISKEEIMDVLQGLLISYFKKVNPYKLQYNPKVLELSRGRVFFKFDNESDSASFSIEHLMEYTNTKKI